MPNAGRHYALIVAVAVIVLFTNLGGPRLWDRDEPRNAGCTAEMLARGDWVTPYFNGEVRTHKPVLLYWLMMTAYAAFGQTEFAARFWSAALSVGTCICTYLIGRRLFSAQAGLWAAVILCTTLLFDLAARAATPDATLIFLITLSLTIFVLGAFPKQEDQSNEGAGDVFSDFFRERRLVVVAMYAAMGAAVLAKGPVGVVLPTAVIGMFLLIMRLPKYEEKPGESDPAGRFARIYQWGLTLIRPFAPLHFVRTCWVMKPLTAIIVVAVVAEPWYVWVGLRSHGEWLYGFFVEHNLNRATSSMEGHNGSLLFYPVAILVGFFPWSSFAGPVLIELVTRLRRGDRTAAYVFLCCWVGVIVGAFSLAQTKLPSYVTPCYPALAVLTGGFVANWLAGTQTVGRRWLTASLVTPVIVGSGMVVGFAVLARLYLPGDELLALIGVVPLVGGVVGLWFLYQNRAQRAALSFATMSGALCIALFAIAAQRVDRHQQNDQLLAAIEEAGDDTKVAAYAGLEPSWIVYGDRRIPEFSYDRKAGVAEFLAEDGNLIITTEHHFEQLQAELANDVEVIENVPYFLQDGERLVLVGRSISPQRTARDIEEDGTLRR